MNVDEILENSTTCRCCLSQEESIFTEIFASNESVDIATALEEICGIDISAQDDMPQVICSICLGILQTCQTFRVKTQQTQEVLLNIAVGNIAVMEDVKEDYDGFSDDSPYDNAPELSIDPAEDSSSLICPYCSKAFVHRRNLQIHKKRHFGVGKFGCLFCTLVFHTKSHFMRHLAIAHVSEKPYDCEECPKRFPTKSELNRHRYLLHNPMKIFSCSECGMQFKLKANAKQHINLVHSKIKGHECSFCGKAFSFPSKLRMHQRSCQRPVTLRMNKEEIFQEIDQPKYDNLKTK